MTNFSKLVLKMTEYEGGCVERVNHFLKVFAFAKTIAEGEDVDDATKEILEAAAITHDIGIRVCFEKYGNCNGPHQEVEGPPIALEMLPACGYTHGQTERICYLIGLQFQIYLPHYKDIEAWNGNGGGYQHSLQSLCQNS